MLHYALKIQPTETLYQHADANARITAVFTELLNGSFLSSRHNNGSHYAPRATLPSIWSVHVNHLNRAIRTTTGKTTTEHIFERVTGEARALLKHTNWNISEISYALGFERANPFQSLFQEAD